MKTPYFSWPLNVDPKAKTASLMDDISADLKGAAEWDVFSSIFIFFPGKKLGDFRHKNREIMGKWYFSDLMVVQ